VSEPERDHCAIHTGLQKFHRRGVASMSLKI